MLIFILKVIKWNFGSRWDEVPTLESVESDRYFDLLVKSVEREDANALRALVRSKQVGSIRFQEAERPYQPSFC